MSFLSFVPRTFDCDGGNSFSGEEGVGTGAHLPPKCNALKKSSFQDKTLHGALQHIGFDTDL